MSSLTCETAETSTTLYTQPVRMSPSIRITEEVKQELEALKRDDETFEELLDRLFDEDEADIAGLADAGIEEQMDANNDR